MESYLQINKAFEEKKYDSIQVLTHGAQGALPHILSPVTIEPVHSYTISTPGWAYSTATILARVTFPYTLPCH